MSRVFWDTNLFIYLIEDFGELSERVIGLRKRMLERNDALYTSAMTLGEVLVKPMEMAEQVLVEKYRRSIEIGATIIAFDEHAAEAYARIRCDRSIRPPDAIQLACAAAAGVDLFITNDDRLSQKNIDGIQFITSLKAAYL